MEELNELFYKDPYLKSFAATVTSCSEGKNGFEVVLDDTAFYPEGGGQPADHGTLGAAQVTDVRRVKGVIIHYTDKPLEAGTKVEGKIDWERRFDNMQNHTGEHVLSGLVHAKFKYENVGFHMDDDIVTVDFNGPMTEEELNPVWQHLLNGEIDILVCTTLIETGIDVRNCNTLIIEDADRMGLAQLYQIRGRVGRSGRKAYAYFTFRRDKTLTDIAQKRLSAIREFTAFGSGFRIAMRDLQIRGAGSLLGHSQHGHMEAVGYDLYVKMLGQAIARARGEPVQRDKSDCLVDLRVDAFIPEKYIPDGAGRIEAYKRIAAIQTPEDAADVLDELIDRYGDPPPSVSDLVNVSLVRVQAAAVGVYEVTQKKDTLILNLETLDLAMIRGLLQAFNGRVTAGAGTKPYLSVVLQPDEKPLELLQNILKAMADILTGTRKRD